MQEPPIIPNQPTTEGEASVDSAEQLPVGRLWVYSTQAETFVLGSYRKTSCAPYAEDQEDVYRVLRLAHSSPHGHSSHATRQSLNASEYPISYDNQQANRLLQQIHIGNHSSGGLAFITNAVTILGVIRFVSHYYLLLVTKKALVGVLGGQKIYRVADIALIPLSARGSSATSPGLSPHEAQQQANAERRYRKLLLGLDLTRSFFFSLSYDLTNSLQVNMGAQPRSQSEWDSPFAWNAFISLPLRESIARSLSDESSPASFRCRWTVPVTHGSFEQRRLSVLSRDLTLTLISRRSRHFAGTRYKKRGLNDQGHVANEVETEQIVDAGFRGPSPLIASFVQVRGSIPLSWSQQTSPLSPKPDVILYHYDPTYAFTGLHFKDLIRRYCPKTNDSSDPEPKQGPVICLNLVKSKEKRPRETILRAEYAVACQVYNEMAQVQDKVIYVPWDFSKHAKMAHSSGSNVLAEMEPITRLSLDATGIFVSHVPLSSGYDRQKVQSGVLRTCCIDCLDRTNVAQFALGLAGLGRQLMALGLSPDSSVDPDSSTSLVLMSMYEAMGNEIAMQYGGSAAHSVIFDRKKGEWEAAAQGKDMLTSLKRFYNNSYTDAEKQDAINLFLGNFVPSQNKDELWELEHDLYLHTGLGPHGSSSSHSGHPHGRLHKPRGSSGAGHPRHTSTSSTASMKATPHPLEGALLLPPHHQGSIEASSSSAATTPTSTSATLNPFMSSGQSPLKIGGGLGVNSFWPTPISPRGKKEKAGPRDCPSVDKGYPPSHSSHSTYPGHAMYYPSSDEEDSVLIPTSTLNPSQPPITPPPAPTSQQDSLDPLSSMGWSSVFSMIASSVMGGTSAGGQTASSNLHTMLPISYGHTYSSSSASSSAARAMRRAARESGLVSFDHVLSCPPLRPQPVRLYEEEAHSHGGLFSSLTSLLWTGNSASQVSTNATKKGQGKALEVDEDEDDDWGRSTAGGVVISDKGDPRRARHDETSLTQLASTMSSPDSLTANLLSKRTLMTKGSERRRESAEWPPSNHPSMWPSSLDDLLSFTSSLLLPQADESDQASNHHDRLRSVAVGGSSIGVLHRHLPPSLILSLRPRVGRRMTLYSKRMAPAPADTAPTTDQTETFISSALFPSPPLPPASQEAIAPHPVESAHLVSLTLLELRKERMSSVESEAWEALFAARDPEGIIECSSSAEVQMDKVLNSDISDLGLSWEQRPWFKSLGSSSSHGALTEAYLTWQVATANAKSDYEDHVEALASSGCIPDDKLLQWYQRYVESPQKDHLIDPVAAFYS